MSETVTVYYDFLCPYAWRGLELAAKLRDARGLKFNLRHFSLVTGNHPENPDRKNPSWWLHEQTMNGQDDTADRASQAQSGSLRAFLADQAAARQGEQARWKFVLALFRLAQRDKQPLTQETITQAATTAELDLQRFQADLQDDSALREALGADLKAAAELGVFGTPTFVLPDGNAAYFRFANLAESGQEGALWDLYTNVLTSGATIQTIKRPK